MQINKLSTDYSLGDIPHSYHPTPQFKRDSFICLNGEWQLQISNKKGTVYFGKITVPFPPESELSGVGHITEKGHTLIYTKELDCKIKKGKRLILHFGAVDNNATVFINNKIAGFHTGGYLPFQLDITEEIRNGKNTVSVWVDDSLDKRYPYGKQRHRRGGMWYTPISGIWQSVWAEEVPEIHIEKIKLSTKKNAVSLTVFGGENEKTLTLGKRKYHFSGSSLTFEVEDPEFWSPEHPHIYNFTLESGEDTVHSYFALRDITVENKKLCLNGKPYFFHGLLDQGYFPDGIYTPKSIEAYRDDILTAKRLGFNMLRKHIKIEPMIFYYLCDTLGIAVFQDMVNNGHYSFIYDTALPTVGIKKLPKLASKKVRESFFECAEETIELLYNTPSVVYYTIFNEGWGQHRAGYAYRRLKALDITRIWDTTSGWFDSGDSDVQSEHIYFKPAKIRFKNKPTVLSEFGGYSLSLENHIFNSSKTYGYKLFETREALTAALKRLYLDEIVPLKKMGLSASVLTQLTDVEDETNGLITYDRRVVKPDEKTMLEIAEKLFNE